MSSLEAMGTLHGSLTPVGGLSGVISGGGSMVGQLSVPANSGIGGLPRGGMAGDLLAKKSDSDYAVEWITPASSVEADNTRPITSAAVYTEIGNIDALLQTI